MGRAKAVSSDFLSAARVEPTFLATRLAEAQERIEHSEIAAEARDEAKSAGRLDPGDREVAGLAPQLAMCEISEELRGERLREVALEVLQRLWDSGRSVHYRIWFEALVQAGFSVSGRARSSRDLPHPDHADRQR